MLTYQSTKTKTICPYCSSTAVPDNSKEEKEIICPNELCKKHFSFIICPFCQQKIFFKTSIENNNITNNQHPPFNFYRQINIKCPYINCEQYFFLTECPKCKTRQKILNRVGEVSSITCENPTCNINYIYLKCPFKGCEESCTYPKPGINNNFPSGIIFYHRPTEDKKVKIHYQKVYCLKCQRPIVFYKESKYYEGQRVECPYKGCGAVFHRVTCPLCYHANIFEIYSMGTTIVCQNPECRQHFWKILCNKCHQINPITNNYIEGTLRKCGFKTCAKVTQLVVCIFCRRPNYFDDLYITGTQIICGYPDCGRKFNSIYCPNCSNFNYFPEGDFQFGTNYICKYENCKRPFTLCLCPVCHTSSPINDYEEGTKVKCGRCKTVFINWTCPFCNNIIIDTNTSYRSGQRVKCPFQSCGKVFCMVLCPGCKHLVFSNGDEFLDGKVIQCQNRETCGINFVFIKCTLCNSKYQELYQTQPIDINKKRICKGCQKLFLPSDNIIQEIYSKNLSVFLPKKGAPLFEGIPYQDRNILEIEEKIIHTEQYKNPSQILNNNSSDLVQSYNISTTTSETEVKKCMICKNVTGESVFAPCGHRCACYPCAMRYFESQKRCPKCQEKATSICKKVYD